MPRRHGHSRRSAPSRRRAARRAPICGGKRAAGLATISACAPTGASGSAAANGVTPGARASRKRLAVACQADHALAPALRASSRTGGPAGRRRTRWRPAAAGPSGTSSKRSCQVGLKPRQRRRLQRRRRRVGLDQMEVDRGVEARQRRAWRAAHRPSGCRGPGPSSTRLTGGGRAHRQPALGQPGAQKLAEHLRDLRRGREVAGCAQRQGACGSSRGADGRAPRP